MSGYAGKIVRINLTNLTVSTIDTADYAQWGGGHGMGSALFYDIAVVEKGLDLENMDHNSPDDGGFHPENVMTIMTSPLSACGVPAATGRTEVQSISVQSYPIGWFSRTNFGGRFGPMLKFAGYDGIVIEGSSAMPVWVDIRDDMVEIRPCGELDLWGKDTVETQEAVWDYVVGDTNNFWYNPEGVQVKTTQRPAVLTIGPAGENKSRMACLIHDASNAAGQGGFGGIWGSKNLKAISVLGTGSIPVADPAQLLSLRVAQKAFEYDVEQIEQVDLAKACLRHNTPPSPMEMWGEEGPSEEPPPITHRNTPRTEGKRPQSCMGCHAGCRARYSNGKANEASCAGSLFYAGGTNKEIRVEAVDLLNRYGFNSYDFIEGLGYMKKLNEAGILGPAGSEIETDLDYRNYGSLEFAEQLLHTVAYRTTPFGDTIAEGFRRAIAQWGRESDIGSRIRLPYWGIPEHGYDGRAELEWGYGSILGDRDINEHCFNTIFHYIVKHDIVPYVEDAVSAQETVSIFTEKMRPHSDTYTSADERMQMLNFSTENMYSAHVARLVSWHRHYSRYYKQSLLFCDLKWPDMVNTTQPDKKGSTGTVEPQFIKAVTGQDISFVEGMRIGRRIWNLDNAVWTLQGRHRDMVQFADYLYNENLATSYKWPTYNPSAIMANRRWDYRDVSGRRHNRTQFENFKTEFYLQEGWDPDTGWPTSELLEELGLGHVADDLSVRGKLARKSDTAPQVMAG